MPTPTPDVRLDPTCRLVTMGCKVNQYETQLVKEALQRHGYREAADDEPAALCVVNTCTVTGEADSKARQIIRQLAKRNPGTKTVVFGCYAAREPQTLAQLPGVIAVVPDNRELPDVMQRFGVCDWPTGISRFDGHRRAFVKVQDGCILNCTYCIIPRVRPGLRSRTPDEIIDEVRRLVANGYKEIILTGIHLGHFGVEATRGRSGRTPYRLWHLIGDLDRIPGDWRLRLSSLEAAEVGPDFLAAVTDCSRLCPHFHLCLQSGSDAVLARMKRRYRIGRFLEKLDMIRGVFDQPAFSTDVIVGFPGETDADFQQTLDACDSAGFMKMHVFPFSPRRDTPAAEFSDSVPAEIRKQRIGRLTELERQLAGRYHQSLLGRRLAVLVEARPARRAGWVLGTACRYVPVEFPGSITDVGRLIDVTAQAVSDEGLSAERGESSACC
ncbi:MAG: tRNA (N(6)-L-threonylcarbamoyladenosine(37)-C(2))-methylthiotransferase MtaB [Planctomycetaceae bacterium]|nr:tRNA (N(6)-L-threonylcarbamoyladenosine(37)-C(2))-methylthiotransferase MtaB [Planctomycetaceae bacterium]